MCQKTEEHLRMLTLSLLYATVLVNQLKASYNQDYHEAGSKMKYV